MALPGLLTSSFGLKPLILTRFEAAGWQLVRVVGVVPRTGASGGTLGQAGSGAHRHGVCSSRKGRSSTAQTSGKRRGAALCPTLWRTCTSGSSARRRAKASGERTHDQHWPAAQRGFPGPCLAKEAPLYPTSPGTPDLLLCPKPGLLQLPTCWKSLLLWIGVGLRTVSYKTGVAEGHAVYQGGRGLVCWLGRAVRPPPSRRSLGQAQHRHGGEAHSALTLTDFATDGHLQPQAPVFLVVDGFGCNTNPQGVKEETFLGRKQKLKRLGPAHPAHRNPPSLLPTASYLPWASLGVACFLPHVQTNHPSLE
ncbi:hypothetical protein PAL_GLEAN10005423 [Pteropus alecto]|uniref:Alkaline phosphatase n=1 Tax=Pteropus alecto TaxID=9402 RepID=L5JUS8_PTEAL|nr:hypothetical protein PAL_GLEAN10005423 [Pteropus alecto]